MLDDLRPELSVRYNYDGQLGTIIGNPHTFPGRFEVRLESGFKVSCSLRDVEPLTIEAKWWIQGFVEGMEPSPYDVLGEDYDPEWAVDSPQVRRWRAVVAAFRETGVWVRSQPLEEE